MALTPPVFGYAKALSAMKREGVDLVPNGWHWSPAHCNWLVTNKNVKRMVENGIAALDDWIELSDGKQYPMRVRLKTSATQQEQT